MRYCRLAEAVLPEWGTSHFVGSSARGLRRREQRPRRACPRFLSHSIGSTSSCRPESPSLRTRNHSATGRTVDRMRERVGCSIRGSAGGGGTAQSRPCLCRMQPHQRLILDRGRSRLDLIPFRPRSSCDAVTESLEGECWNAGRGRCQFAPLHLTDASEWRRKAASGRSRAWRSGEGCRSRGGLRSLDDDHRLPRVSRGETGRIRGALILIRIGVRDAAQYAAVDLTGDKPVGGGGDRQDQSGASARTT